MTVTHGGASVLIHRLMIRVVVVVVRVQSVHISVDGDEVLRVICRLVCGMLLELLDDLHLRLLDVLHGLRLLFVCDLLLYVRLLQFEADHALKGFLNRRRIGGLCWLDRCSDDMLFVVGRRSIGDRATRRRRFIHVRARKRKLCRPNATRRVRMIPRMSVGIPRRAPNLSRIRSCTDTSRQRRRRRSRTMSPQRDTAKVRIMQHGVIEREFMRWRRNGRRRRMEVRSVRVCAGDSADANTGTALIAIVRHLRGRLVPRNRGRFRNTMA